MPADPWAELAHHPGVQLVEHDIPERGRYYHRLRTIVLRRGMRLVEQRCALWHELIHVERGDRQCDPKSERLQVEKEAARRAIDVHDLADAMLWSDHVAEQADQLKVTEDLLRVRLEHLHPAERGYLRRAIATKEQTA